MKTTNYNLYVAANSDSVWSHQGVTLDLEEAKFGASVLHGLYLAHVMIQDDDGNLVQFLHANNHQKLN